MDPNDSIEETHLSRYMNRRRKRVRAYQVAFVLLASLLLVAVLEAVLNPGALELQSPRASASR